MAAMEDIGAAKVCPAISTSSTSAILIENGMLRVNWVPLPRSEYTPIWPRRCLTISLTTSMPTPRPASCDRDSAVEKPERRMRVLR